MIYVINNLELQGLYPISELFVCHIPFAFLRKDSEEEMQD